MLLTYICLLSLVIFGVGYAATNEIITDQNFACAFNTITAATRKNRLDGLKKADWKPSNKEEAAVFLAHVFHETDGLKTVREYCAPGQSTLIVKNTESAWKSTSHVETNSRPVIIREMDYESTRIRVN